MALMNIQVLLTGCILFTTLVSVSATCAELEQCFTKFGSNIAILGSDAQNPDSVINFLCQNKNLLTSCYDKYAGCETYKSIADLIPNKEQSDAQMTLLCKHKDAYSEFVRCTSNAISSLTPNELQTSAECETNLLQSSDLQSLKTNCQLMDRMTSCSPLIRAIYRCIAPLMILMQDNGVSIPCIETYKSLSSGKNKVQGCIVMLLACYVINIFIRKL